MLVEKGGNTDIDNNCLLVFSAEYGHLEVVKYLIEKGANIHLQALHFYLKK